MASPVEFRFEIKAYTPETIPLERLAFYLERIATLLGESKNVHLLRIEGGSTVPVFRIDWESVPKVKKRVNDVRNNEGPAEARNAKIAIERALAEDNAPYGELIDHHGGRVIHFPGRDKFRETEYGPFNQAGTLDGVPIVVGGENDPVPVHLQDRGGVIYNCLAERALAKRIGLHLFTTPLRVDGVGRWYRSSEGVWSLRRFLIRDYRELKAESLHDATARLRAIDAAWKKHPDPVSELVALRGTEEA
jgi:hypothetical protein